MVQLPTDILREKLEDVELPEGEPDLLKDDSMLWRYLKARSGNIEEAQKMVRKSIEWRRTYKPYAIDCQWCHQKPGLHSLRQVGFDEAGRPVLYSSFTQAATSRNTAAEAISHLTYVLENAVKSMPDGVSQWVLVFDCSGMFLFFPCIWKVEKFAPSLLGGMQCYLGVFITKKGVFHSRLLSISDPSILPTESH
ncbi:unnamed protein product [Schistocephalus solidus]|uniref:CRAL_TRIO_N domain-containing protein n=1 Tax=Schistocephalus solidus TaxID=70667 RepID=A0A183TA54_SCHSO|nr:unnamed protein product [Schistocephalus solidus]